MANGGTVDLTLRVHSDVTEARKDIQSLQSSLQNLVTQKNSSNPLAGLSDGATKAAHEIAELNAELQRSKNASGGLDVAKLAQIWQKNGKSLEYYKEHFKTLGKEGQNAFNQLTQSVARAQAPVRELDGLIGKFTKGLLNTAMWTVQSNAIHAFQSAIQSATRYAQDLNKGLTDIAIVSDLTSEKLAQFAKDANKYAQQYSTTTSEYVKGALIYYQQGLSGEEVIEKTNTTVKMANTSGESAEQISSYMTAIWNNFDDGSKSVEYFADVIAYLGAETAASNADIAEGMQAFAATANTVGLSYEYAASALTTLRHVTQQSASTIGNSLKTIFARLDNVKLGETLEDDVDLTKYTKALASVGVNVLDINGELKDMDQILDDLAAQWDNLSRTQKDAVAQTVGGVRQYNNLISLMDNYDYFQSLVEGSKQADGYLEQQNEKFEESWLGATRHIQTAVEKLYDILIDDKFLIKITNFGAKVIDIIGTILEKAGGLRTLLPLIVSVLSTGINNSLHDILQTVQQITTTTFGWTKYKQSGASLQAEAIGMNLADKIPTPEGVKNPKQYDSIRKEIEKGTNEVRQLMEAGAPTEIIETLNLLIERNTNALKVFFEKTAAYERALNDLGSARTTIEPLINKASNTGLAFDFVSSSKFKNTSYADIQTTLGGFGIEDFQLNINKNKKEFSAKDVYGKDFNFEFKNKAEFQEKLQEWISSLYVQAEADLKAEVQKAAEKEAVKQTNKAKQSKKTDTKQSKEAGTKTEKAASAQQEANANKELAVSEQQVTEKTAELIDTNKAATEAANDLEQKTKALQEENEKLKTSEEGLSKSIDDSNQKTKEKHEAIEQIQRDRAHQINAIIGVASAYGSLLSATDNFLDGFGEIANGKVEDGFKRIGSSMVMMITSIGQLNRAMSILATTNKELYGQLSNLGKTIVTNIPKLFSFSGAATMASGGVAAFGAALKATAASLWEVLAPMVPVALGAIALTAALKGLKWVWDKIKESTPSGKLKKLKEETEKAKEEAEKASQEYDNLVTTLSGVEDKKKALVDLAEGTEEWKNAVAELNKELLLLINQSNLVYGEDWEYDEKGIVRFINDGEKKLRDDARRKAKETANKALVSEVQTNLQEYNNNDTKIKSNRFALQNAYGAEINWNDNNAIAAAIQSLKASGKTEDDFWKNWEDVSNYSSSNYNKTINSLIGYIKANTEEDISNGALKALARDIIDNPDLIPTDADFETWWASIKEHVDTAKEANPIVPLSPEELLKQQNEAQLAQDTKRAKELGFDPDEYQKYVAYLQEVNEELKNNQALADNVALANMRLTRGLNDLEKNGSDWLDIIDDGLTKGNEWYKNSLEYHKALDGIKTDLADVANVDVGSLASIDGAWVKNHQKTIESAFAGDKKAVDKLVKDLNAEIISGLDNNTTNALTEWESTLIKAFNDINLPDLEVGISELGGQQELLTALQNMITASDLTAEQINTALKGIHFSPIVEWKTVPFNNVDTSTIESGGYVTYTDDEGIPHQLAATDVRGLATAKETGLMQIPVIKSGDGSEQIGTRQNIMQALAISKFVGGTGAQAQPPKKPSGGSKTTDKSRSKEIDRYHEINSKIEQNSHALEMLNTEESRAYGPDKLRLMDEKIKLLEHESELYKQLYDEAKAYYDADRTRLANEFGAQFNEDGSIANYDKWFGAYIAKYNAGQMSDEQMQKLEDYIKKYEDSLKHLNDAEKKYQDDLNKIYDLKLEKIEYRLKTLNKLIDQANDYLDHMIKQLDKSMYDTADVIALLGEKIGNVLQQAENERAAIGEIFANHGLSDEDIEAFISGQADIADILEKVGTLTADEVSKLQEHQSALLKYSETLIQIREESYEKIGESIDEFNEKIDRQIDIIKDLDGVMSHYKNIIDIVGKDVLGISDEMLKQMDQLAVTAAKSVVEISADQYNQGLAQLEEMRAREKELREQGLIEDADLMLKEIEAQEDRVMGFKEKFKGSWEDAENVIKTAFLNTIKLATDAFGEAMAGQAKTLDNLREYYDMQKTLQDRYLPTYQKIYELNKLTRDVNNAIDNTTNIAGKQRLLELQEDILKRQKEGVEVTEYEIGFLQRRLELEQARIAMEEAQNAKSMVRMTRDSEGNWSYTYTADSDKANAAKQNYEDKLYELKKYNQESLQSFQDALLQATEDYRRKIADLNLTDEERAKKIKEFQEDWVAHNKDMFQMAIDDAHWIIGEYNGGLDDLIDKFDETILAHETGFADLEDYMNTFTEASNTMMTSVTGAYQQWQINNDLILEAAGTSVDNFKDKVLEDMKDIEEAMVGDEKGNGGAVNATKTLGEEMKSVFDDILKNLKNWFSGEGGYSSQIDSIAEKNKILYSSIQSLITQYNNLTKAATDYANTPQGSGVQGGGGTPGATGGNSGNNNGPGTEEDKPIGNGHWEWNDTKHWWVQQWSKSGIKRTKEAAHTFSHVPGAPSNVEKCTVCGYTHEKKNSGGGGSSGGGCFVAGTRITMANGSIQYIENIKIGDMVMAYNDETQEFEPREVTKSYIHHDTPAVINVYFEDGTVLGMTPGHPLLSTKGWKSRDIENSLYEHGTIATWLEVNDEIINLYHQTVKVTAIIKQNIPEHYDTYNIEVETCHTFIADGMVVHNMKMFDSGGYTGSFGPEGRIAVLHEKELVLNKADTENLLTTISFVRDLTRMISLNAAEAGNGLGNLFSTGVGQGGGFLDQNVTIHAEFPNATNHSEIEEAFSNLIGLASQYAGRRK